MITRPQVDVHTWATPLGGVTNLIDSASSGAQTDHTRGVADADIITASIQAQPEGSRGLITHGNKTFNAIDKSNPDFATLFRDGPFTTESDIYYNDFFGRLRDNDAIPDHIFHDIETGNYTYFSLNFRSPDVIEWIADSDTWDTFPRWIRTIMEADPTAYDSNAMSQQQLEYMKWSTARSGQALRKVLIDPANAQFGYEVPATNFGAVINGYERRDDNGWKQFQSSLSAHSSPVMYLNRDGNYYRFFGFAKDRRWNAYLNEMFNLLSCIEANKGLVTPWFGFLEYSFGVASNPGSFDSTPWLTTQMLKQVYAALANQIQQPDSPAERITLALFNPVDSAIEQVGATQRFSAVVDSFDDIEINTTKQEYGPDFISMDDDYLDVCGVRVEYEDHMANM